MALLDALPAHIPPGPLATLRRQALARVRAAGVPTVREEAWKYTDLRALDNDEFVAEAPGAIAAVPGPALLDACAHRLVFVDGILDPARSRLEGLPVGVQCRSFAALSDAELAGLADVLGGYAGDDAQIFAAVNAACARDGAVIDLAPGAILAEPLLVAFLHSCRAQRLFSAPLVIVRAGTGSEAAILELHHGEAGARNLSTALTHIAAAPGSALEHWRVQQEAAAAIHLANVDIRVARDARVASCSLAFGAQLARADIVATLAEPGAAVVLNGLFNATHGQHVDHQTRIDHVAPHTSSEELYKGLAGGNGRGVFRGQVIVRPDAQHITARQASHNLLLSPEAEIDTKPELEIYADDVSCAHGATVGQLDDSALFYLTSRGIPAAEAHALLVYGFTQEVAARIRFAPLRAWLAEQLAGRADIPLPDGEEVAE